jgi:hypothetical protein
LSAQVLINAGPPKQANSRKFQKVPESSRSSRRYVGFQKVPEVPEVPESSRMFQKFQKFQKFQEAPALGKPHLASGGPHAQGPRVAKPHRSE